MAQPNPDALGPRRLEAWLRRVGVADAFVALAELLPGAAVVLADAERRILYWSPAAERLLGLSAEQVLGERCPDGILCDRDDSPRPFGVRVSLPRADGNHVQVRHFSRLFHGPEGVLGALHLLEHDLEALPARGGALAGAGESFHGLRTRDPAMARVLELIRNVAETDATVLVRGESGTGKELVARAIHEESRRRGRPFVAINCASLSPSLLESELFGHVKGAFTGAVANRAGIFRRADGGTLFLDEVAEIPIDLQAKLLRVLQEQTFVPVGGSEPEHVDVRVIAATHRALREEVRKGRFREDLLYRLRVVPIFLPPLRERRGDIELLVEDFIQRFSARGPRRVERVSPEAMRILLDHSWPGNVRELQNTIEYAFAVGRGPELVSEDLPPELRAPAPSAPAAPPPRSTTEAERLQEALEQAHGDLQLAAERLGVSRTTLWRMRKKAGL